MSSLYDASSRTGHVSLTLIIAAVSVVTFAIFGGLYFLSLAGGEMITKTPEAAQFAEKAPPAWIPPEERVPPGQASKAPGALKPQEGQL